jgi:small-conductance mechanosensitive channel
MNKHALAATIATVKKLGQLDPMDVAVEATVKELEASAAQIGEQAREAEKDSFGVKSMKDDIDRIHNQIDTLHSAAVKPLERYQRIMAILGGLKAAVKASERPQYASIRPKIAGIVQKLAGIFAEVDTVEDLDKPLEVIEKAVHSIYGDQSSNSCYYFDRRGKGYHTKE